MNPIRSNVLAPTSQGNSAQDAAKMAAARAFFAAAMGQGNSTAVTSTPEPTSPGVAAKPASASATAEAPQKYLRPGSLIDIRV